MVFQVIQTQVAPHGTVEMDSQTLSNPIDYQTHSARQKETASAGNKNTLIKGVASAKLVEATLPILWDELIHLDLSK